MRLYCPMLETVLRVLFSGWNIFIAHYSGISTNKINKQKF